MHQAANRGTSSTAIPVGAGSTAAASTTRHATHARTLSAFADVTTTAASTAPAAAAPSGGDDASSEPQPFLKQRRLPSILLDSWEFRKLAAEGSVMANAMVSYDVDDDGVEEVIVGTTEGLLCVVKPDCRAPLFARVLAATISVVLYTPLRRRLVLITLEGQCEVMDYFLSPNRQQPRGYHRSESTSSLSRAGHAGGHNTAGAAAVQQPGQGNLLHNLPRNRSHTSLTHPLLAETVSQQPATPPTHVFHVPSNCLCADLSTDAETDLIFLGSYDRRFYVYSITSGTCLLSLFVHDPITSVKAFTIPTAGAETRRQPTSSSFISVYDKAGRRRQRHHSTTRHDSRPSATTTACNTPGRQTDLYVPLVFIATTTHLILLPAGSNEIQQWRRLQPKTAHLPLTVQLQADAATPQPHQQAPQRTQSPARRTGLSTSTSNDPRRASTSTGAGVATSTGEATGLQRRASCDGGGGGAGSGVAPLSNELRRGRGEGGLATAAAVGAGTRRSLSEAPEGETPVPPLPRSTRSGNMDNGSHAAMPGSAYGSGAGSRGRSGATAAAALGGGGGDASRPRSNSNGRGGGSGGALQSNAMAAASARESNSALQADVAGGGNGGAGNSGGNNGVQLTTSQQRRQARKRAIQAAEMGRPVLVKPLWALHINSHTLDVPPLQSSTEPFENNAAATTAMSPSGAAAATSEAGKETSATYGAKRANVSPLTVSATHDTHHSVSAASHHRHGSRQRRTIPRGDSTSLFSISSPSSVSGLRDNSDVFVERASATQIGGRSLLHRQSVRSSRDGGEDTEALAEKAHVLNAAAVAGLATLERSGSGQGRSRSPPQEQQQQRVRRQQRRPPRLLRSVNADSISSEEGSLDGVLGEGVGSSASGDDAEGEADAAGEAGSRGRLSSRPRREFDRAEEFSEGVRFSLPVEGSEPTTLAGRPATAEDEDGGEESSHGGAGGAESESSDDATYDCSTSDSHCDDEDDDDDVSEDSYRSRSNNGARRPGAGSAREAKETTPSANAAAVNPSLLARSLARMRAESVPTTLLRRLNAHLTPSAGGANEAGGINAQTSLLDDPVPTRDAPAHGYGSGVHTSLMDLASLDEHGRGHRHHRHHHRRDGDLTDGRHPHNQQSAAAVVVDSIGSEGGDVRLPMSVDVSVGMSQVAVALSCEDGLAMELRFTVARLSSLSRRARQRTGRAVRLYDLRHPPCPFQLTSRAARHEGGGRQRRADVWSRPPRQGQQQQQSQPHQPASSPSSPTRPRSFSRLDDLARHRTSHMKGGRGGGTRRPTSLILLPQPIPGPHCTGASPSPLPQAAATTGGAARQAGAAAFQTAVASNSFSVASSSSPAGAQVTGAKTSASGIVTGSERGVRRRGQSPQQQQQQQQRNNGLRTPSPTSPLASGSVGESARSQRYEEEAVVLRAQCLWAARLGDSPLVQRARVFCVRDRHQQNTFCTVFVAANGTCYAIDGDTLSVVECSVKEDCSSFTLMAGPSSTMPLLGYDPMTAGAADGSGEALTGREPAAASPSPPSPRAGVNANLLRGAVGRTVSCVCVSVDELCIYSVGEANQLVQHRDAPHAAHLTATSTATVVTPTETTSLLSRRPPNNPCTSKTTMKRKAPALSDGEKASETRRGWWDGGLDDGLPAVEAEERELLRQLALRLMEHEGKHQESSKESEEATLLRVRQLLLHGYSDAEWDKMRWLDSGVT